MPWEYFRCGSEYHLIAKCTKPLKWNDKRQKQVSFNEKGYHACNRGENNSDQKIYAYMACMSGNDEFTSDNIVTVHNLPFGC